MRTPHLSLLAILCVSLGAPAHAASLKQAQFTRVINDVRLLPSQQQPVPAKIGDTVSGLTAVSTGVASRAELQFPDKTLTRIGANSVFKLDKADRTVDLEKGVMLLQVPKQIGGAKVRTAAVTAAVTGTTVMFEYDPNGTMKIIVLEGEVDVFLNDNPSEVRTLRAGDMLIMNVNSKTIPMAVQVDLELLKKTSKLLNLDEFPPLGNQKHLADALKEQDGLKSKGELLKTAFEIVGRGTQVTLTNEARQQIFKNFVLQNRGTGSGGRNNNGNNGGNNNGNGGQSAGTGNQEANKPPRGGPGYIPGRPILNAGTTVFGAGSTIVTNPHATAFNSISGSVVTMQGTVYNPALDGHFNGYMYGDGQTFPEADSFLSNHGSWFVFKGDELVFSGDIAVNTTPGPRNILLGAVGNVFLSRSRTAELYPSLATNSSWTIPTSVDALFISSQHGSITLDSSFALYGSGGPQDVAFYAYGLTSDVLIQGPGPVPGPTVPPPEAYILPPSISIPNGTFKAHAGHDIVIDSAKVEAGQVKLNAKHDVRIDNGSVVSAKTLTQIEALGKIQIQNSAQLVTLSGVDPLTILLKAVTGNVEITGATLDAANIEMVSGLGSVSITDSYVAADVIKARVLSTGGELFVSNGILGRYSPSASSLIKLYGEGVSGVRFAGDNVLNAASVDIAGRTVTIEPGGLVRLSHPGNTRVHTDTANFNNSVHGNFTNSGGTPVSVTTGPYAARPAY